MFNVLDLTAAGIGVREAVSLCRSWISDANLAAISAIAASVDATAATRAAACLWEEWEGLGNPGSITEYYNKRTIE